MSENVKNPDMYSEFGEEFSDGSRPAFEKDLGPIDNGSIEFAVMTQMGVLKDDPNGFHKYHRCHWGYRVPRNDDPTKTIPVKFYCIRRMGKNKMVIEECPQCVESDSKFQEFESYRGQLQAEKRSESDIKDLTAPLKNWLRTFNNDGKQYLFVFTPDGNFRRLRISHKTYQQLEAKMNEVAGKLKLNPRSPRNLVMWKLTRIGSSKQLGQMSEVIEEVKEAVVMNGQTYEKTKIVSLTAEQCQQALAKIKDVPIHDIGALSLTYDQIKALVETQGDPEAVRGIVNLPQQAAKVASAPVPTTKPSTPPATNTAVTTATVAAATSTPPVTSSPVLPQDETEMWKALGIDPAVDLA
jgi:hypothetical protein